MGGEVKGWRVEVLHTCDKPNISWSAGKTLYRGQRIVLKRQDKEVLSGSPTSAVKND